MNLRDKILDLFENATVWVDTFDDGHAARLAQDFVDNIVARLRRDPRWAVIPRLELEILLADTQQRFEEDLCATLDGYAPSDELLEHAADVTIEICTKTNRKSKDA